MKNQLIVTSIALLPDLCALRRSICARCNFQRWKWICLSGWKRNPLHDHGQQWSGYCRLVLLVSVTTQPSPQSLPLTVVPIPRLQRMDLLRTSTRLVFSRKVPLRVWSFALPVVLWWPMSPDLSC